MAAGDAKTAAAGTFLFPVMTDELVDDPWHRPYLKAPRCMFEKDVSACFPLKDFRTEISDNGTYVAGAGDKGTARSEWLSKYGFTAVKQESRLLGGEYKSADWDSAQKMIELYYPEVKELVKQVTGAKAIFCRPQYLSTQPIHRPLERVKTPRFN
jgi:hypothetical protein